MFSKSNKEIMGVKLEFKGQHLTKLGFIYQQLVNLKFELLEVTEVNENKTRVLGSNLVKVEDSQTHMEGSQVLVTNSDSKKSNGIFNFMITSDDNMANDLKVGVT